MTFAELYQTLAQLLIAGIVLNVAAIILLAVMTVMELLRCRIHNIPFESLLDEFSKFWFEGFMPTMFLLMITILILKVM